jgi:Tfp pilus assembly protein PilV
MNRRGFSFVEMIIAIIVLNAGILGLAAATSYLVSAASTAGLRAEVLQTVEGRVSQIASDPRYHRLDSIYAGKETHIPGLDGMTRVTEVVHTKTLRDGRYTDYKTVTVSVVGPGLVKPVSRVIILGSP